MDTDPLIKEITNAFSHTAYPGDDTLTIGQLDYQEYNGEHEAAEIARDFAGTTWNQVTDELMINHKDGALAFFTEAAFAYYLPVYMILILQKPEKADVIIDTVINMLVKNTTHHAELLTAEQNTCVSEFLEYCKKIYEL